MTPKQHIELKWDPEKVQMSYVTEEDILEEVFPTSPKELFAHQQKDNSLLNKLKDNPLYHTIKVEGKHLVHYKEKIVVPATLKERVMYWFHTYLVHPGSTRMLKTI